MILRVYMVMSPHYDEMYHLAVEEVGTGLSKYYDELKTAITLATIETEDPSDEVVQRAAKHMLNEACTTFQGNIDRAHTMISDNKEKLEKLRKWSA